MLGEPENQFSLTRATLSTWGREKSNFLSANSFSGTYLKSNAGHLFARAAGEFRRLGSEENDAIGGMHLSTLARQHLKEVFSVEWSNATLLDVGCGQLLRLALIFGIDNKVVGIDVELPFRYPYAHDFFKTIRRSGLQRAIKTAVRQMLGIDRRFRRSLMRHLNVRKLPDFEIHLMDAMNLEFPENSFDGVYSFSVFQYISNPALAAEQIIWSFKARGRCVYSITSLYLNGWQRPSLVAGEF